MEERKDDFLHPTCFKSHQRKISLRQPGDQPTSPEASLSCWGRGREAGAGQRDPAGPAEPSHQQPSSQNCPPSVGPTHQWLTLTHWRLHWGGFVPLIAASWWCTGPGTTRAHVQRVMPSQVQFWHLVPNPEEKTFKWLPTQMAILAMCTHVCLSGILLLNCHSWKQDQIGLC